MSRDLMRKLLFIFGILLCAIAVILFATPFATVAIGSIRASVTGFALIGQLFKDNNMKLFGVFASFIATLGITIVLIGELIMKGTNQVKKEKGLKPTTRLIMSLAAGLIPFILNFLVLYMTESEKSSISSIGGGAIASSILIISGILVFCITDIVFDEQPKMDNSNTESIQIEDRSQQSAIWKGVQEQKPEEDKSAEGTTISSLKKQLIELKELLELGLITQEEFDAKKKQLLGL